MQHRYSTLLSSTRAAAKATAASSTSEVATEAGIKASSASTGVGLSSVLEDNDESKTNKIRNKKEASIAQYLYERTSSVLYFHHHQRHSHRQRQRQRRRQLQHRQKSHRIQRSYVVLFLVGCVVLLCGILTITHTLGIRMIRKQTRSRTSLDNTATSVMKVPYPPNNIQISVIVMNHARPYLLQQSKLLPTLVTHPNVQSIYILHSNPNTKFNNDQLIPHFIGNQTRTVTDSRIISPTVALLNQKIHHIDAVTMNAQWGLAIRFHYCAILCNSTKFVLHVDDDMEFVSHSVINTLLQYMMQNPQRIVGHYGRAYNEWVAPFRHGYDTKTVYGNVEVVLTKILILEQVLCQEFFKYTDLVKDILFSMKRDGIVKWNGEDIFINLVANHYYHVPMYGPYNNYAIADLDVWDVDTSMYDLTTQQQEVKSLPQAQQQLLLRHNAKNAGANVVVLENAISGNMDRNRIWNVGWYQWYVAYQKAQAHTKYRGLLWYTTKQRLYQLSS